MSIIPVFFICKSSMQFLIFHRRQAGKSIIFLFFRIPFCNKNMPVGFFRGKGTLRGCMTNIMYFPLWRP